MINGRATILAGTNNYLGLTFHPDCIEAACQAAAHGRAPAPPGRGPPTALTAIHSELERELAKFLGCAA